MVDKYFVIDLKDSKVAEMKTKEDVEKELHAIFEQGFQYGIEDINACKIMVIKGKKCDIINYDISIKGE